MDGTFTTRSAPPRKRVRFAEVKKPRDTVYRLRLILDQMKSIQGSSIDDALHSFKEDIRLEQEVPRETFEATFGLSRWIETLEEHLNAR